MANDAVAVDDEQAAERDAVPVPEDAKIAGNVSRQVGQDWNFHRPEAALIPGGVDPGQVGEVGVGGARDDL